MSSENKIIIVEDDRRMAQALQRHLCSAGYEVDLATNGSELRLIYRRTQADLIMLDLNLGGEDGIDLARELVASTSAAVIIVTGRHELQDRIEGLDAGADDYIVKPFVIDELLARVRAVLRRRAILGADSDRIALGPFELDPAAHRLRREDDEARDLTLTAAETRILSILMRQSGRAVSRERLMSRDVDARVDRTVDVHIGNIRRKLRQAQIDDLIIWSVRGFGYRLRIEPMTDEHLQAP
jgi:DNA-binding response OmpR family regulator